VRVLPVSFASRYRTRQIRRERNLDMLATLRIRNLALVADLTLEFPSGLVAVTGETGTGKSVILGALHLLLGERAERTLIRAGADTCSVEAVFDVTRLGEGFRNCLTEHGLDPGEDGQLVLRRSFTAAGANRQFVNGTPTTLTILGYVGNWLVDMHGPHEHQSLLQPAQQLAILDAFGSLQPQVEVFRQLAGRRRVLQAQKTALIVDDRTYAQQIDLLRFQVQEITAAGLRPGEDADLEQDHQRAANAARLLQLAQAALGLLDGDAPVATYTAAIGRMLQGWNVSTRPPPAGIIAGSVVSAHDLRADLTRYPAASKPIPPPANSRSVSTCCTA
jgi:DNA repair protein RecN (Recombination protein N)